MITISWNQLGEHIEKGDLKEWVKDLRQADKGKQFEEDTKDYRKERDEE